MNQRRRGEPGTEPIYSEADLAEFRERWEQAEKERQVTSQLASLNTRMDGIPGLIEEIAKRIISEITTQQRKEAEDRRRSSFRFAVGVAAVVVVFVVPIETAIIAHLYP